MSSDDLILDHIFNPSGPVNRRELSEPLSEPEPITELEKGAKQLELEAVKLAEQNDFDGSLQLFNEAILKAPSMASLYNNRAQLLRLKGDNELALDDINMAIELGGQGKSATQAYTQRAMLHMLNGDEDAARIDFEKASELGGKFAMCQAAKLNPYAKMCNQMLSKAMESFQ